MTKTNNRPAARARKLELRRNVLDVVKPAHVLDAFCGDGQMWRDAWSGASSYTGIDLEMRWPPHARRFVADNRDVLRAIDLKPFNIFDLDAYGSPWTQALIVAHRRRWSPGERGAIVLTDGASMKTRFGGGLPRDMAHLLGRDFAEPRTDAHEPMHRECMRAWCRLAGVEPVAAWIHVNKAARIGSQLMVYSALVFDGRSES